MKKTICSLVSLLLLFGQVTVNFASASTPEIEEYIKALEVGSPFNYRNLTIVPIYAERFKDKTDYITLDEAVNKDYLAITELDGGRVPQVRVRNNSSHYILLVAGEILTGCRQDRLVGRDVLIGPKSKDVILPVYCSEHGRWSSKGDSFYSENYHAEPVLRGMLYSQKPQEAIWDRIGNYSSGLGVQSKTEALQDVYRDTGVKEKVLAYTQKLEDFPRLDEDAVGVAVGLGDKVIGIDIFANPSTFANLWPKLLKSYAALAILEEDARGSLTQRQAKDTLNEIFRAKFYRQSGLDLGEELQANISGMVCSSLVYHGAVIHLGVFPAEGEIIRDYKDTRIRVIE